MLVNITTIEHFKGILSYFDRFFKGFLNVPFLGKMSLHDCKLSFFHGENETYAKQIEIHSTIQHFAVFLFIYVLFKSDSFPRTSFSACLSMLENLVT